MTTRKSKRVVHTTGMQRYFVTKWAGIVLGTGAFFVALGLLIATSFIVVCPPEILAGVTRFPSTSVACLASQQNFELTYSLFFYGGLQMAIGISTLLFSHFRKPKARDLLLLGNKLDNENAVRM